MLLLTPSKRSSPYAFLPMAVFSWVALCFVFYPTSAFHRFALSDPDDYMRLVQVLNWLSGQGWFDLSQPRLSPGDHTVLYWSRLVDVPLAGVTWLLAHFMDIRQAIRAAALTIPPALYGLCLLPLVVGMARPLVPGGGAVFAALMVVFATTITFNFSPGRVGHHAYQVLIAGFGFLCLQRIVFCLRGWRAALMAAVALACGLWIGAEGLPALVVFGTALTLAAGWRGGRALRHAAVFGVAFALLTVLALLAARRPEEWHLMEMTWFSGAYVLFAMLLGGVLALGWLIGRGTENRGLRLSLLVGLGVFSGALFFLLAPKAINGPYADFERLSAAIVLDHVGEAQPLFPSLVHSGTKFFCYLFLPIVAFGVIVWNFLKTRGRQRWLWGFSGLYLVPMVLLTLFWAVRVQVFVQLFSLVPLTWLVWRSWGWLKTHAEGRVRFWAEIVVFAALGLFPTVLFPAIASHEPLMPDVLMFPGTHPVLSCNLDLASGILNTAYGDRPRLIMSTLNEGPELLFRTRHNVLSAPYNVAGNRDSLDFFSARDDQQAERILKRRNVDLVLVCRQIAPFYAGIDRKSIFHSALTFDGSGELRLQSDAHYPTLVERLLHGEVPAWLKPVAIPFDRDYLLFEVRKGGGGL